MLMVSASVSLSAAAESAVEVPSPVLQRRLDAMDFVAPVVVLVCAAVVGWYFWERRPNAPMRGVRRAVRRARAFNEATRDAPMPTPVPEMDWETKASLNESVEPIDRSNPSKWSVAEAPAGLRRDWSAELWRLRQEREGKSLVADYYRLDAFVRRYLFERYRIRTFGVGVAAILDSLPQDPMDAVIDYAGEVLRVCELAQLTRYRPTEGELDRLYELVDTMIRAASGARQARSDAVNGASEPD